MNRIDALRDVGRFIQQYQSIFSSLPRDTDGKPANVEIRKLLAIDQDLAIALAALLATVYFSMEHETGVAANNAFEGRGR